MFHIITSATIGIEPVPITVETDVTMGLRSFSVVGLPDASVKEARDRIRAAMRNTGFRFPRGRVTVNLAPADVRKQGPVYDLPIALSILLAMGVIPRPSIESSVFIGELALDGSIRPVRGSLTTALMTHRTGRKTLFVPEQNVAEASALRGLTVYGVDSIRTVVDHLLGVELIKPASTIKQKDVSSHPYDFSDVKGQEGAKRGLEIAAAGAHNILLKGPPGAGKTLLARSLPSILPDLSYEESLEVTSIASIAGISLPDIGLIQARPFRTPHHSASAVALVGGGAWPKPGEVSLAHRGVLFLDELPEFSRYALEHLRQPLEDGHVTVSRAAGSVQFPARFLLAAAMNPCPCGHFSNPNRHCTCRLDQVIKYQKRISGPLLDRFDIVIEVPAVKHEKLLSEDLPECSEIIRRRVNNARMVQRKRMGERASTNNEISTRQLDELCKLSPDGKSLLEQALRTNKLSARGYTRVRKVARTIADLEGKPDIEVEHLAEALQYRGQDAIEL
ncbi:MAG: YifB family Mg chelatase-like AAA ATPase [Parcubacteria group bacterium]|nr:YifB family Mg chelatase-like AAA ATPase [Parcubacteria group bacterium]